MLLTKSAFGTLIFLDHLKCSLIVLLAFLTFTASTVAQTPQKAVKKPQMVLQFHYMMYACGECSAQYKVTKVIKDNGSKINLKGKDLSLIFNNPKQEAIVDQKVVDCRNCYEFICTGELLKQKSKDGNYTFKVYQLEAVLTPLGKKENKKV